LEDIAYITQKYNGVSCFDIILQDHPNSNTKTILNSSHLSFCSDLMKDWVKAIRQFKECSLKKTNKSDGKILVDFQKVNEILKSKNKPKPLSQMSGESLRKGNNKIDKGTQKSQPNSQSDELNPLYYNNERINNSTPVQKAEENKVNREVNRILQTIKERSLAEKQVKRQMESKLKEASEIAKELEKKNEILKKEQLRKEEEEKKKLLAQTENKKKSDEIKLLKAVTQRLEDIKSKEIQSVRKEYINKISNEKEKANSSASKVMIQMTNQNKLEDYSICKDRQLNQFKNKEYVNDTCMTIFGESQKKSCALKENFCNMCCENFVGNKHMKERMKCKGDCENSITGKKNTKGNKKDNKESKENNRKSEKDTTKQNKKEKSKKKKGRRRA
jgi:chemotaxis protein histidine kinase CheA